MTSAIKTIGIIGAGQMGSGIAHVSAQAGYDVLLYDISAERIEAGIATISGNLARQVSSGKMDDAVRQSAMAKIKAAETMEGPAEADMVIEAATEDETVKRKIFAQLCPVLNPEALLATNTSSISITRLAAQTDRPERFIGIHFMNPVPVMKLVELVRGIATEDATFELAQEFVGKLDKTITVSEDFPAFIVNRILLPMINEAVYTLYEGVGTVIAIDTAMKLGANHPMGPLELADFIGLDTCLSIMNVLYDGLSDSKYRPCPLLVKYVEAGWLGRKTGRGFYDYREGAQNPEPTKDKKLGKQILWRILVMLINEAADALYLNIASRDDIELAMTKGVNYPKGLLQWADEKGINHCVATLGRLHAEYLEGRYRCSPLLRRMAREGRRFFQ